MRHPIWQTILPQLRDRLDNAGLQHVRIVEEPAGPELSEDDFIIEYGSLDAYVDEFIGFEPKDPNWRIFKVANGDDEIWAEEIKRYELCERPMAYVDEDNTLVVALNAGDGVFPAANFPLTGVQDFIEKIVGILTDFFQYPVFVCFLAESNGGRQYLSKYEFREKIDGE